MTQDKTIGGRARFEINSDPVFHNIDYSFNIKFVKTENTKKKLFFSFFFPFSMHIPK